MIRAAADRLGRRFLQLQDTAAFDSEFLFENDFNGFGIDSVFLLQDSGGERVLGVVVIYGNDRLQDDRARVEIFVYKMYGAAGEFHTVFESLALRFEAWKGRKQGRMNVQDSIWERRDKIGRQEAHITGQADQIDFVLVQHGDDLTIIGFAFQSFRWNRARGDTASFGTVDAGRSFAIADQDGDFGIGNSAGGNALRERFEIRTAAA